MEKLYRKLEEYSRSDYYPFHMPGHKRNPASVRGEFPLERDITEIEGFDNPPSSGRPSSGGTTECGETVWDQGELLQC